MSRSFAPLAPLLCLVAACSLVPEDDVPERREGPKGPQFDADYYAVNAKEYMNGGQFGRAKAQWETFLTLRPNDWMARLGIGFADVFLAEEAAVRRGDFKTARSLVAGAERTFTELQSGPIEDDTEAPTPTPNWKAALGAATAARCAGYLDQIESKRDADASLRGGADAAERRASAEKFAKGRDANYARAIAIFERLAAMKHESPEAVRNLAQLYLVTRQDAKAEIAFERYLGFARASRKELAGEKAKAAEEWQADRVAIVESIYDEKLTSNAAKQIGVLDDLAGLAFARGDYRRSKNLIEEALAIDPDRKDLYLKLAQSEGELQMYESAVLHVDEFLKRSSRRREDFDDAIFRAMKLKQDYEKRLAAGK